MWAVAVAMWLGAVSASAADSLADAGRYSAVGMASWYGGSFTGGRTADGERLETGSLSAAHKTLPIPCYARVTNLRNGRSIVVRVNDRGPFVRGRIIDVSSRVATLLDFRSTGVARVKVDYVGKAPSAGADEKFLLSSLRHGSEPETDAPLAYTTAANARLIDGPALSALVTAYRAANEDIRVAAAPPAPTSPFGDLSKSPFLEVVAGN